MGLGFNIIGGEEEVGIFISVIAEDGVAGQAKKLNVGDMILEVTGESYACLQVATLFARGVESMGNVGVWILTHGRYIY